MQNKQTINNFQMKSFILCSLSRTAYAQSSLFSSKSQTFGFGQTIWATVWADKFWGIWGIFSRFISTHFGTVSPLSMFSINQPLFRQKTKHLHIQIPNIHLGLGFEFGPQRTRDLGFVCPQSVPNCFSQGASRLIHKVHRVLPKNRHLTFLCAHES